MKISKLKKFVSRIKNVNTSFQGHFDIKRN